MLCNCYIVEWEITTNSYINVTWCLLGYDLIYTHIHCIYIYTQYHRRWFHVNPGMCWNIILFIILISYTHLEYHLLSYSFIYSHIYTYWTFTELWDIFITWAFAPLSLAILICVCISVKGTDANKIILQLTGNRQPSEHEIILAHYDRLPRRRICLRCMNRRL